MDGHRFDALTKRLGVDGGSRRGLLRALAGGGLAAVLATAGTLPASAACRKNGKECNPDKPRQCCSGICKKSGRDGGKCRPAPGARGCTNRDNICLRGEDRCPGDPAAFCYLDVSGRPFCGNNGPCTDCNSHQFCAGLLGPGARCIVCGGECIEPDNPRGRACVIYDEDFEP